MVDYTSSGNGINASATLEQTGASWTDNVFNYTSTASITTKQLQGSPSITYSVENGIAYKTITQTYLVRVLTTLTRGGKNSTITSISRSYPLTLSVKVKE